MPTTELVLLLVLMTLLTVALSTTAVRALRRRRRPAVRDDTLRAGQGPAVDGSSAALRAIGRNAWMLPGGGGF
ncbi:hypothetical protein GTR02_18245 [Kineococcus sp. R8]|uniref:hypothetical protein n=1 Tax=Kineococcus siccus TaxID=2696567 RepID=UPI0014127F4C|nr:hypothetical protein [Kineococcus siccus]NAZ83757.1 hypothetical protein [Kineococcus siccus]